MSNIIRQVGAGKTFLSPTDFYVQVNTSGVGEVELVLPNITSILANINTSIFQYIGIRFIDNSSNASVNNIVLTAFDGQTINGETQVRLNTNGVGGLLTLIGGTQWSFNQNSLSSGGGMTTYKLATLPSKSYSPQHFLPNTSEIIGDLVDAVLPYNSYYPFIRLNNGNIAQVNYCQSVLYDGTFIYECYDRETLAINNGYWVAFQVNPLDSAELIKVGEVQMTQQFWDNWYDYTYKDPAITNEVKLVTYTTPNSDTTDAESWITTLTYANGVLMATDTYIDFGGVNFGTMFNNLSGQNSTAYQWWNPTGILDDDYYGMGYGTQSGWVYFVGNDLGANRHQYMCSYSILTGATRIVNLWTSLASMTNFSPATPIDDTYFGSGFDNHTKGLMCYTHDQKLVVDYGNDGVTCIWSPYWTSNQVTYIKSRQLNNNGIYSSISGFVSVSSYTSGNWYWDGHNIYLFYYSLNASGRFDNNVYGIETYKMDSQETYIQEYPVTSNLDGGNINSWADNDGMMFYDRDNLFLSNFGNDNPCFYMKDGEKKPFIYQQNNIYPTNIIGNKTYSTWSDLIYNYIRLGVQFDEYENYSFTK